MSGGLAKIWMAYNDGPCFDQTIEINKAHANTNKDDLFWTRHLCWLIAILWTDKAIGWIIAIYV
jgi:hypothetical protein